MTPSTIIDTNCIWCAGRGKRFIHRGGRATKQSILCGPCKGMGVDSLSILERCYRHALGDGIQPEFHARKVAPVMAEKAIAYCGANGWCSVEQAIMMITQHKFVFAALERRESRNALRADAISRRGQGLGKISPRKILMRRLAQRRGFSSLAELAIYQYRHGGVSNTVYAHMDAKDLARMQFQLGFITRTGNILTPELSQVVYR